MVESSSEVSSRGRTHMRRIIIVDQWPADTVGVAD
jgi:hypothetical protein